MANTLVERIKAIYAAVEQQRRRGGSPGRGPYKPDIRHSRRKVWPRTYRGRAGLVTMFLTGSVTMLAP